MSPELGEDNREPDHDSDQESVTDDSHGPANEDDTHRQRRKRGLRRRSKRTSSYTCRTEVRPSSIEGAGDGLWMLEDAAPGDRVALYTGDILTAAEAEESDSAYMVMVNKNLILDARDPAHGKGRFINCGRMAGKPVNAAFGAARRTATCPNTGRPYISIRATKRIPAGTEVLVDYGPAYWGKGGFNVKGERPRMAASKNVSRPPRGTAIIATPRAVGAEPRDAREVAAPPVRRLGTPATTSPTVPRTSRTTAAGPTRRRPTRVRSKAERTPGPTRVSPKGPNWRQLDAKRKQSAAVAPAARRPSS